MGLQQLWNCHIPESPDNNKPSSSKWNINNNRCEFCQILNKPYKSIHSCATTLIWNTIRTVSDLTEWYPRLQYYDVQTLEHRYISKLPMKNERIWSYVKETTSHLQNKLTKNIHLRVATRSSTKWDCLKPIRYTWGLQHFLTFFTRGYRSHQMLLIQNYLFILE